MAESEGWIGGQADGGHFFFLIVVYLCDCGVRKTELCVCVCTRVCKCMDVCLRMHNAQTVN